MNDRVEELSKEGDCFNGMTARRNMFKLKESTTAPGQSYSTAEAGMTQAGTPDKHPSKKMASQFKFRIDIGRCREASGRSLYPDPSSYAAYYWCIIPLPRPSCRIYLRSPLSPYALLIRPADQTIDQWRRLRSVMGAISTTNHMLLSFIGWFKQLTCSSNFTQPIIDHDSSGCIL